jgi:hypothetical protein
LSAPVSVAQNPSRSLGLRGVSVSPLINHGAFGLRECESSVEMDAQYQDQPALLRALLHKPIALRRKTDLVDPGDLDGITRAFKRVLVMVPEGIIMATPAIT